MFVALRAILVIGGVILTSLAAAFGLSPATVQAPATTVPARVNVAVTEATTTPAGTTAKPAATSTAPKPPKKPATVATVPKNPDILTPGTPEYQQSLKNALDALSKATAGQAGPSTAINDTVRAAVVNIVCTTERGGPLNPISASGVVIDPRGIVLTNAHVAQYFLLKDYPAPGSIQCVIRTGSPARPLYTATLLFISPSWIADNASKITASEPTGTGEHDYALLVITGVTGPSVPIPSGFAALPIATASPDVGTKMLIAGYPAGFLDGITIQKDLYESSAEASVGTVYTFGTVTPDLFSIGGTILSQHGSSGGAVATEDGILTGLVVTATEAPDTASRDLRALATSYLIRDFASEAGISLSAELSGDILKEAATFNATIAPSLTKDLVNVLER